MTNKAMRRWSWVHKWSSLISTIFLLMLCITGLPLIFHHEIDHLLHEEVEPAELPAGTPHTSLDKVVASALTHQPGKAVQFLSWDEDEPDVVFVFVNDRPDGDPQKNKILRVDARTAAVLDAPELESRFTGIMLRLHTDMYLGLGSKLFLGLMGLLFAVAVISGVVVYAPSMKKLDFGTVRFGRPKVVRRLDLHNVLGIATTVWLLVVGVTGVINTWADLVLKLWQFDQVSEMLGPHKNKPRPEKLASIDAIVANARKAVPNMEPRFIAFPANPFSGPAQFIVFMNGQTPLTSRLLQPVVLDGATAELVDTRPMPWYVTALFLSQPLHFGDYGGMALKILWGLLDLVAIAVLWTGLNLWSARRRQPIAYEREIRSESSELASVSRVTTP